MEMYVLTEFCSMNSGIGSSENSATALLTGCLDGSPGIFEMHNTCTPSNAGLAITKNVENDDAVEKASSFSLSGGTTSASTDASPNADSSTTLAVETVSNYILCCLY
ncbi:fanconi-associated nuclease 1 [Hordeum vulgare]|nr:fanconi-associated nuclease 1 [Hordeum vulgare]